MGAVGVGVRLLGAAGLADHWLTVPLVGAFPWFALWALVTAGVLVVRRTRGTASTGVAACAVACAGLAMALLVPRVVAQPQPRAGGEVLTVGVVNVRIGAADLDRVVAVALEQDLDLLAVVEATPAASATLVAGPLRQVLPAAENATTTVGGIVLARGALAPLAGLPHAGGTPDVLWTTPGGTAVAVTTLHASAPIGPTSTARWRDGLARTPVPAAGPALVLGDFNATIDHAAFRDLLALGWRDAATQAGAGLALTYDGLLDASPGLPMAIDHALVGPGIAVRSFSTHDVPGTDHRLVATTVQLP